MINVKEQAFKKNLADGRHKKKRTISDTPYF